MQWFAAKNACAGHTPAVSGGTWSLPTEAQWTNMKNTAVNYADFSNTFGLEYPGGTYWSSTETDGNLKAWVIMAPNGSGQPVSKELTLNVRAVLVF